MITQNDADLISNGYLSASVRSIAVSIIYKPDARGSRPADFFGEEPLDTVQSARGVELPVAQILNKRAQNQYREVAR